MQSDLSQQAEKRNLARFKISSTSIILIDDNPVAAETIDINPSGISVKIPSCSREFHLSERFRAQLNLHSNSKPIPFVGKLVAIENPDKDHPICLHLLFDSIADADKARLCIFLRMRSLDNEKRSEIRLPYRLAARVWVDDQQVQAFSEDISFSGIRLHFESSNTFAAGMEYTVDFALPNDAEIFRIKTKVARIYKQDFGDNKRVIAFLFLDISEQNRDRIHRFIDQKVTEHNRLSA